MKAPGLTAAMRRKLLLVAQGQNILQRDWDALCEPGFAAMQCGFRMLTPRGFAALAAPRMTAAELASLESVEQSGICFARNGLSKGWIEREYVGAPWELTQTGLTALNNMRAAMGSAEFKETV